jgi:hypothetical protein
MEAEMFDANLTASTLSLRATLKNGEIDVAIGQKNTVQPQADLFETEDLLVKGGCLFWICGPDSNVLNPGHDNLRCVGFSTQWLGSDNLVQSFNHLSQLLWRRATNHLSYSLDRERSDLADFDP